MRNSRVTAMAVIVVLNLVLQLVPQSTFIRVFRIIVVALLIPIVFGPWFVSGPERKILKGLRAAYPHLILSLATCRAPGRKEHFVVAVVLPDRLSLRTASTEWSAWWGPATRVSVPDSVGKPIEISTGRETIRLSLFADSALLDQYGKRRAAVLQALAAYSRGA